MPLKDNISSLDMPIIADELADLHPTTRISSHAPDVIEYHSPLIGNNCADTSCVYVVASEQLQELISGDFTARTCFVCVGKPPALILESPCNVIWIERERISLPELVVRMTSAFKKYMRWERDVTRALVSSAPVRNVMELSAPLFVHPLCLWDLHFQTLYHGAQDKAAADAGYQFQAEGSVWSAALIDAWADSTATARSAGLREGRAPFARPSLFSDNDRARMLCQHIYLDDRMVATICVDDLADTEGSVAYEAVKSRLRRAAIAACHAMEADEQFNTSIPHIIDTCIHGVLSGKSVAPKGGYTVTEIFGWDRADTYHAVVADINRKEYPDTLLRAVAEEICGEAPHLVYTVFEHNLVFIVNVSRSKVEVCEVRRQIASALVDAHITAFVGQSDGWVGLDKLPLAHRQASLAAAAQSSAGSAAFSDVLLDLTLKRAMGEERCETFLPQNLRHLREVDEAASGDLLDVLRAYLDCNCSITATSRHLYMHRNTLSYKMDKIKRLLDSDLSDPDERLLLSIALRFMNR